MVELAYYLGIVVISATLYLAIRWRGLFSYEGIGLGCCLAMVTADALGIAAASIFGTGVVDRKGELATRLYPSLVFELGVLAFLSGLALSDRRPRPVVISIQRPEDRRQLVVGALAAIFLGLTLKAVGMISYGVTSLGGYLGDLGAYTTAQHSVGGFLNLGVPLALVGLALLGALALNYAITVGTFLLAALISFTLSGSRAELFGTLFLFFIVFGIARPEIIALARRHIVIASLIATTLACGILINSGVKSAMRVGQEVTDFSITELGELGLDRWLDRFSSEGLYDGYCNFVSRLSQSPQRLWRGEVGIYAMTSAVPYFLYPSKPVHPFRDTGYLVYNDLRSSVDDVCATTLIGSAYADFGVLSVGAYLIIFGTAVGILRRVLLGRKSLYILFYINIIILDGASNFIHAGILAFVPSLAINAVVALIILTTCRLFSILNSDRSPESRGPPIMPGRPIMHARVSPPPSKP